MTAAGRPARDGSSIGAVMAQLRGEFPDVTISKIRFLEAEGLVRPSRTPSGYRQFTPADVERLRFVLAAQRDHYLPLKVIKEQLEQTERGGGPPVLTGVPRAVRSLVPVRSDDSTPTPEEFAERPEIRMTREELVARTGLDPDLVDQLEQYGLVRPGPTGHYDADAAEIARTVEAMMSFGIEPRHLRAFRASADREVGLLEQIVTPMYRHRDPGSRERADEVVRELAALSVGLHLLLVRAGLRGVTGK